MDPGILVVGHIQAVRIPGGGVPAEVRFLVDVQRDGSNIGLPRIRIGTIQIHIAAVEAKVEPELAAIAGDCPVEDEGSVVLAVGTEQLEPRVAPDRNISVKCIGDTVKTVVANVSPHIAVFPRHVPGQRKVIGPPQVEPGIGEPDSLVRKDHAGRSGDELGATPQEDRLPKRIGTIGDNETVLISG